MIAGRVQILQRLIALVLLGVLLNLGLRCAGRGQISTEH